MNRVVNKRFGGAIRWQCRVSPYAQAPGEPAQVEGLPRAQKESEPGRDTGACTRAGECGQPESGGLHGRIQ